MDSPHVICQSAGIKVDINPGNDLARFGTLHVSLTKSNCIVVCDDCHYNLHHRNKPNGMMKGGNFHMLGQRLRLLRQLRRLTQEELSKRLGVERTRYTKWESEASEPSLEMLCRIADYFHVSTDYLLGRTNILTPPGRKN